MQIFKPRLRQAMIDAGFALERDGTVEPNKLAFARALAKEEGKDGSDKNVVEPYRRSVQRWTDEEDSAGMSRQSLDLAGRVLGVDPDELTLERLVEVLLEQQPDIAAAVERLTGQVESLALRIQALEQSALGPRDDG